MISGSTTLISIMFIGCIFSQTLKQENNYLTKLINNIKKNSPNIGLIFLLQKRRRIDTFYLTFKQHVDTHFNYPQGTRS